MKRLFVILLAVAYSQLVGQANAQSAAGEILTSTDTVASVTATSSVVLAASNRQDATIVNTGATACYLSRSGTAVSTKGIYLAASGGYYNIDQNNTYRGAISAVTASGSTTLAISEGK